MNRQILFVGDDIILTEQGAQRLGLSQDTRGRIVLVRIPSSGAIEYHADFDRGCIERHVLCAEDCMIYIPVFPF